MESSKLAMYFLILDDVPDNLVPAVCAHGSLMCYWEFESNPDMLSWRLSSFKKRVCRVNQKEFDKAKESGKFVEVTESTLNGRVVAAVYSPRSSEWENVFKFAKLWKPC